MLKTSLNNPHSERIILDQIIELASSVIRELFGAMGSQEFVIHDIIFKSNKWVVVLLRRIDSLNLNLRYEMVIDNETGKVIRFRRKNTAASKRKKKASDDIV